MNFFSWHFPLHDFFFCSPPPRLPIHFSNGPSLSCRRTRDDNPGAWVTHPRVEKSVFSLVPTPYGNVRVQKMVSVSQFVWLVVTLGAQKLPFSSAATCVEREDQVQGYLISSKPPFDNYYNISKAVYPSVDLPSLLIKITVRFLATADYILIHQNGTSRSLNVSNVSTTEADVLQTTGNETRTNDTSEFTWSASCLYVSGGDISMTAMNFFSLFAIWPNRRERHLHVSLPQFCKGYSSDTMIYFLSTVGIFYSIVAGSPSSKYEHR